ncbi:MAG: phosphoribosylaminoimidazolesuccinocarboxamide synthase, partial [Bacteroidales bacterium]
QGKSGQQVPFMSDEYCQSVSERYIELFEKVTGDKFVRAETEDVSARIERNVSDFLKNS